MMMMKRVKGVELPPNHVTMLKPGGYHVMLIGLKKQLQVGERYPFTLKFHHAPEVTLEVPVRQGPPDTSGHKMHQHHN